MNAPFVANELRGERVSAPLSKLRGAALCTFDERGYGARVSPVDARGVVSVAIVLASCAGAGASRSVGPSPAVKPAPASLRGLKVQLRPVDIRGVDAHNARELDPKLRDAMTATLLEAGFAVVGVTSEDPDVVAFVRLDVEFYYPDMMKAAANLRVERKGEIVLTHVVPGAQVHTPSFTPQVAARFTNALSEARGLEKASTQVAVAPLQKDPFTVAVFDIEDRSSATDQATREQLTDYLSASSASALGWRIIPRSNVKAALSGEKVKSYEACVDEACQIELGKTLAAEKVLSTRMIRVGQQCALTSTLLDLRTEAVERAGTVKVACDSDALLAGIDQLVRRLGQPTQ